MIKVYGTAKSDDITVTIHFPDARVGLVEGSAKSGDVQQLVQRAMADSKKIWADQKLPLTDRVDSIEYYGGALLRLLFSTADCARFAKQLAAMPQNPVIVSSPGNLIPFEILSFETAIAPGSPFERILGARDVVMMHTDSFEGPGEFAPGAVYFYDDRLSRFKPGAADSAHATLQRYITGGVDVPHPPFDSKRRPAEVKRIITHLKAKEIVHFHCHVSTTADGQLLSVASDFSLSPLEVSRMVDLDGRFVFFNGCGAASSPPNGNSGWAEAFTREMKARCFIGPICPIDEDAAIEFAERYYEHLLSDSSQAFRAFTAAKTWLIDSGRLEALLYRFIGAVEYRQATRVAS